MAAPPQNSRPRSACRHSGLHSGMGRYSREFQAMRFVIVCDECGAERREVHVEAYVPRFVADPGDAAAA